MKRNALPVTLTAILLGLFGLPANAANDDLGTLLLTPAQRDFVDGLTRTPAPPVQEVSAQQLAPGARYNGSVQRSGGPVTGWVDGVPVDALAGGDGQVRMHVRGRRLVVQSDGETRLIEPGESVGMPIRPSDQPGPPDVATPEPESGTTN